MYSRFGFLLLLLSASALAEECYTADAASSEVVFRVTQSGAPFSGTFRKFNGELCFDKGRLLRISATLDPASIDSGLPELDVILKDKDFFAVREFPLVKFSSSAAQSKGEVHTVRATLEIKGVRRETEVMLKTQTSGGKLSVSGNLTLDRLQYGVGTGEWSNTQWLGAEVQLQVKATLTPKK
jgi:polyisoprenoid-binding protein YceI